MRRDAKKQRRKILRRDAKKQKRKKTWRKMELINLVQRWKEMAEEKMQKVLALLRFFAYDKK